MFVKSAAAAALLTFAGAAGRASATSGAAPRMVDNSTRVTAELVDGFAPLPRFAAGTCAASCGTSADKASDVKVSVSPCAYDPSNPVPVTITLSYTLNEVVSGGTETIDLKWNGVGFPTKTLDLCEGGILANDTSIPCPTPAPPYQGSSSTTITPPKGAPGGSYVGRQTWTDKGGNQILCLAYILSVKGE